MSPVRAVRVSTRPGGADIQPRDRAVAAGLCSRSPWSVASLPPGLVIGLRCAHGAAEACTFANANQPQRRALIAETDHTVPYRHKQGVGSPQWHGLPGWMLQTWCLREQAAQRAMAPGLRGARGGQETARKAARVRDNNRWEQGQGKTDDQGYEFHPPHERESWRNFGVTSSTAGTLCRIATPASCRLALACPVDLTA